jgi:hypothetical protein
MRNLEQETESINQAVNPYQAETYNYDYSHHESTYEGAYGTEGSYDTEYHDSTAATTPSTLSASAPQDAESHAGAPEGTVAHGSGTTTAQATPGEHDPHHTPDPHASPVPNAPAAPHNA